MFTCQNMIYYIHTTFDGKEFYCTIYLLEMSICLHPMFFPKSQIRFGEFCHCVTCWIYFLKQFGHIETTEFPRLIQVDKASEFVQKTFQKMEAMERFEYPSRIEEIQFWNVIIYRFQHVIFVSFTLFNLGPNRSGPSQMAQLLLGLRPVSYTDLYPELRPETFNPKVKII